MLTELECKTLDSLYDNKELWFEFLWQISDRVQEEDEVAAEGIRFLCGIRQRPTKLSSGYWWCVGNWGETARKAMRQVLSYSCYLPREFDLYGYSESCSAALSKAISAWCNFSQQTRSRICSEWLEVTRV